MPGFKDLSNKRFGKLIVTHQGPRNSSGKIRWFCKCDCGNTRLVVGSLLLTGRVVSCGCVVSTKQRLFQIWGDMMARCYNPRMKCYKYYGGKGITVCNEWHVYSNFESWALCYGYSDVLTIDRINPSLGYFADNCRWVPKRHNQMRGFENAWKARMVDNQTRDIIRCLRGSLPVKTIADLFGCCQQTVRNIFSEDS